MKNNIYKGYIASRNIQDLQVPHRIQNIVIRLYAEKRGKVFSLSATEYIMENCFMILKALVNEAQQFEAIVFYSMFMLPKKKEERLKIFTDCLNANTEIHFAFEELAITSLDHIQVIEDILLAKELSQTIKETPWPYKNL